MRMGRRSRAVCIPIVALALVAAGARRAAADEPVERSAAASFDSAIHELVAVVLTTIIGGAVVAVSGVAFTIHDGSAAFAAPPPIKGWSIAETAVATPLGLGLNVLTAWLQHGDLEPVNVQGAGAFVVLPTGWMTGLATHGIWALTSPQTDPRFLLGASMIAGIDLAFTTGAVSSATSKHLGGRGFGAVEMISTAPSIAVGLYELASPGRPYKPAFAGLTVWSSALFAHGIAAVATGVTAERARLKKLYPDNPRFSFAPTVLGGGPVPASALVVGGVW